MSNNFTFQHVNVQTLNANKKMCVNGEVDFKKDVIIRGDANVDTLIVTGSFQQPCTVKPPIFPLSSLPVEPIPPNSKIALVTGASRGNGRAIAETLKSAGYYVIGTSRVAPGGPYNLPRFRPPVVPNVDVMLRLDIDVESGGAPSIQAFITALDTALVNAGNRPLDVIVFNGLRFCFGTISGTFLNEKGLPPYAVPNPQASIDYNTIRAQTSDYQVRLLTHILYDPVSGGLTQRINPLASNKWLFVTSIAKFALTLVANSTYDKKRLSFLIDTLRGEFAQSGQYPNTKILEINPVLVETYGLETFMGYPDIGPLNSDPIFTSSFAELFKSLGKSNYSALPADIGLASLQLLQLSNTYTDAIAASPETSLARSIQTNGIKAFWCGDPSGANRFKATLDEEYTQAGKSNALAWNLLGNSSAPILSENTIKRYDTLSSTTPNIVLSGFNLDGAYTTFTMQVNNNTPVAIATTYVPANPPVQLLDQWTATVNLVAYSGQTVTLRFTATTPNAVWTDNVNALNVRLITNVTVP